MIAIEGRVAPHCDCPWEFEYGYTRGRHASIAIDDSQSTDNDFFVVWQSDYIEETAPSEEVVTALEILAAQFDAEGNCVVAPRRLSTCPEIGEPAEIGNSYSDLPSVAISEGEVRVAWVSSSLGIGFTELDLGPVNASLLLADFSLSDPASTWPLLCRDENDDFYTPSAGIATTPETLRTVAYAWLSSNGLSANMYLRLDPSETVVSALSSAQCGHQNVCPIRVNQLQPCVATYNGITAIAWANTEIQSEFDPPFNIHLQLFDSDGERIGSEITVNDPSIEQTPSQQFSPAVDFFGDEIVVSWIGETLPSPCTSTTFVNIFTRRLKWIGGSSTPYPVSPIFIVNTAPYHYPGGNWNPTVAISREDNGRWIVAWTTNPNQFLTEHGIFTGDEIHAQFFQFNKPVGTEFRINQDNNPLGVDQNPGQSGYQGNSLQRRLGNSNQHTIRYGIEGEIVCVWSAIDYPINVGVTAFANNDEVFFTRLPPGFDDYQAGIGPNCCKGDMNGNGYVQGNDIAPFIAMLLDPPAGDPCDSIVENYALICAADANNDGLVSLYDVDGFVDLLLDGECNQAGFSLGEPRYDCDGNEVEDALDLIAEDLHDCNDNGYPDECELELPFAGATDCNENGVPDECDVKFEISPDCNENGIPDECDIASQHSTDIDHDGIPDECALMEFYGPSGGGLDCADIPEDLEAAWAEFYLWAAQQTWGPASGLSGAEQYQLIVDKKCELGLLYLTP